MAPRGIEPFEEEALEMSGQLLQFAAQNSKDLPADVIESITAAVGAKQSKAWDDTIAGQFWVAFNKICMLIKPVTFETISTGRRAIPGTLSNARSAIVNLISKAPRPMAVGSSLAQRSAAHYLTLLGVLLVAAVFLTFALSTVTSLKVEIGKRVGQLGPLTQDISEKNDQLIQDGHVDFSETTNEQKDLQRRLVEHYYLTEQVLQKARSMSMFTLGLETLKYQPGSYKPTRNAEEVKAVLRDYYVSREKVGIHLQYADVFTTIVSSSVLPIVLGLMGACSYVVRLISDQIKDSSFSTTSPIRHRVRLALGGLAGVVIGYGGLHGTDALSPSALAFLAGYAVEPVFSVFDGVAAKFRA